LQLAEDTHLAGYSSNGALQDGLLGFLRTKEAIGSSPYYYQPDSRLGECQEPSPKRMAKREFDSNYLSNKQLKKNNRSKEEKILRIFFEKSTMYPNVANLP